jgi:hypothetical protein
MIFPIFPAQGARGGKMEPLRRRTDDARGCCGGLIDGCKECRWQVEPDPTDGQMTQR